MDEGLRIWCRVHKRTPATELHTIEPEMMCRGGWALFRELADGELFMTPIVVPAEAQQGKQKLMVFRKLRPNMGVPVVKKLSFGVEIGLDVVVEFSPEYPVHRYRELRVV